MLTKCSQINAQKQKGQAFLMLYFYGEAVDVFQGTN